MPEQRELLIQRVLSSIKQDDVDRVKKEVLARLRIPRRNHVNWDVAAGHICFAVELARLAAKEPDICPDPGAPAIARRKPLAGVVTALLAQDFVLLTEKPPSRISKTLPDTLGLKETGEFAKFLDGVFAIFKIKASGAGQVRVYQKLVLKYVPKDARGFPLRPLDEQGQADLERLSDWLFDSIG
jgi:hypothetical protein